MPLDIKNSYAGQIELLADNLGPFVGRIVANHIRSQVAGAIDDAKVFKNCLTCKHFIEHMEACEVSSNQRPPARVIAYGCPQFLEADVFVPF